MVILESFSLLYLLVRFKSQNRAVLQGQQGWKKTLRLQLSHGRPGKIKHRSETVGKAGEWGVGQE